MQCLFSFLIIPPLIARTSHLPFVFVSSWGKKDVGEDPPPPPVSSCYLWEKEEPERPGDANKLQGGAGGVLVLENILITKARVITTRECGQVLIAFACQNRRGAEAPLCSRYAPDSSW